MPAHIANVRPEPDKVLSLIADHARNYSIAVECAMRIFQDMKSRGKAAEDIEKIRTRTHQAAIRIIDKQGQP